MKSLQPHCRMATLPMLPSLPPCSCQVFNVSGAYWQDQPVLALYAVGKTLGCVLDLGHDSASIAAVTDGGTHTPRVARLPLGGAALGAALERQLAQLGATQPQLLQLSATQRLQLKEAAAVVPYTAERYQQLLSGSGGDPMQPLLSSSAAASTSEAAPAGAAVASSSSEGMTSYTLPDGNTLSLPAGVGAGLGEALFAPQTLLGLDCPGLAQAVVDTLSMYPEPTQRSTLFDTLFICGGGAAIPNIGARLQREVRVLAPPVVTTGLLQSPEYMPANTARFAPFVGGAVLSKVVSAQSLFMTKGDYEELGPQGVHRKCP